MIEYAIPAIALALLFIEDKGKKKLQKESFQNVVSNFPVEKTEELSKDPRHYELSNSTVDKYFGKHPDKLKHLTKKTDRNFMSLTGEAITKNDFEHNKYFVEYSISQRLMG